jgi:sec-independent protein translocase protein TatA
MFGLENPVHLLMILGVLLLLFGAKRLPEMGRSMGSGLRGFKDALSNDVVPDLTAANVTPAAAPAHEREAATISG